VASSDTIDVGAARLLVTKPISLVAAPGFRPSLAAGQTISARYDPGAGVDWSVTIDGFTIPDGAVSVAANSGNATVTLRNLVVTTRAAVSGISSGISAYNDGSGSLQFEISGNLVHVALSDITQPPGVYVQDSLDGAISGAIHDNRILGDGLQGIAGIAVRASQTSSARVYANQISGNISFGLQMTANATNVAFSGVAVSNAIRCTGRQGFAVTAPGATSGTSTAQIFNNTIVDCQTGINVSSGTALNGRIANNLIVDNGLSMSIPQAAQATLSNDHNLLFGNGADGFTADATTIRSNPLLLRGRNDPRLGAGSPAIDAADSAALRTLLAGNALPEIDADGLRRFKGGSSAADIGAFESGDHALVEFADAASGGVIDAASLNAQDNAVPQLVQDSTPDTYAAAATDAGLVALDYASNEFGIVDDVDGSAPTAGSAYNLFVPAAGAGAILHTSSAGNVTGFATKIDNAYTNSRPDRIVLATHRRGATAFDHPYGAVFVTGFWYIVQTDAVEGDTFPAGLDFHVYAQDPSLNAFSWTVPAATTATAIDHPLLNGEPCGRLYVTSGDSNPHPFKVGYASGRWTIENTVNVAIPAGASFNVVVDEHAIEFCRFDHIFHDGLD
jgi:hypothetical protein